MFLINGIISHNKLQIQNFRHYSFSLSSNIILSTIQHVMTETNIVVMVGLDQRTKPTCLIEFFLYNYTHINFTQHSPFQEKVCGQDPAWGHHWRPPCTSKPSLGYFSQWHLQLPCFSSAIEPLQWYGSRNPTSQLPLQSKVWPREIPCGL